MLDTGAAAFLGICGEEDERAPEIVAHRVKGVRELEQRGGSGRVVVGAVLYLSSVPGVGTAAPFLAAEVIVMRAHHYHLILDARIDAGNEADHVGSARSPFEAVPIGLDEAPFVARLETCLAEACFDIADGRLAARRAHPAAVELGRSKSRDRILVAACHDEMLDGLGRGCGFRGQSRARGSTPPSPAPLYGRYRRPRAKFRRPRRTACFRAYRCIHDAGCCRRRRRAI